MDSAELTTVYLVVDRDHRSGMCDIHGVYASEGHASDVAWVLSTDTDVWDVLTYHVNVRTITTAHRVAGEEG